MQRMCDVIVIGAGVFGAWTAWKLREAGKHVLLMDAWGPAHARSSSGGESRLTRTSYGKDAIYSQMAWDSLADWSWLSAQSGLPIFHKVGALFFFGEREPYVTDTIEVHHQLNIPLEILDRAALIKRWPQINYSDIEIGLYEPELGALMARRAVQTLVQQFVAAGGEYLQADVVPLSIDGPIRTIQTRSGEYLSADQFVFACGPWLPKLFPTLLGSRIFPTRQEIFFFMPEAGDDCFEAHGLPGWAELTQGELFYGFPSLEGRGFKLAHDKHGPPIDPDEGDRVPSPEALARVRAYMAHRFPALASRPLTEFRVCQYENSSNGDFLIDRHPKASNVWLVGGGSGHGFKHGPAVGRYVADAVLGRLAMPEPRFSLATKATVQNRAVH